MLAAAIGKWMTYSKCLFQTLIRKKEQKTSIKLKCCLGKRKDTVTVETFQRRNREGFGDHFVTRY